MADSRHDTEGAPGRPLRLRLRPGTFAVEVTRNGTVLGRHSSADVRLPLPDVSRQHCRFLCESGRWQVLDLDSLNGIFVNGEAVRRAELRDGDQLRVGGFVFEVELRDAADGPAHTTRTIANALPFPDDRPLRRAS
jgi:pSer/pThr/pTyr-binding forkhead associated (FHA) protein